MVALVSCRPSSGSFHSRHAPLEDTIAHQEVADYIAKYCHILSFSVFESFGFVIFCRISLKTF